MANLIEAEWQNYREKCVPSDASASQVEQTEVAFYAGASTLWLVLNRILDPGTEPTNKDLATMQQIQDELEAYAMRMSARAAAALT